MAASIDNVKMLLIQAATGYAALPADDALLTYLLQSEERAVLDDCNLAVLPEALDTVVEERAAGRFLQMKKADVLSADDLAVVSRIEEGDTTVEFEGTSAESRLDGVITSWLRERDLLRW